jgi:hypothetical protein
VRRYIAEDKSKEFLPRDFLDELVTEQNERLALLEADVVQQESDPRKLDTKLMRLMDAVLRGDCRQIFLILVLMTDKKQEYLSCLEDFERSKSATRRYHLTLNGVTRKTRKSRMVSH